MGCADVLNLPQPFPGRVSLEEGGEGASLGGILRHICCSCAPGRPDILQSRSDRHIQINQFTVGKGLESSKSSETRSGLEGRGEAMTAGARRGRLQARPGCWCSDGSQGCRSPTGIFLHLPPGPLSSSPPPAGLLSGDPDGLGV